MPPYTYVRSGARPMRTPPNHRVLIVGTGIIFLCTVFYLPLLTTIRPPVTILDWHMNRDLRLYVRPDNQTALIDGRATCPGIGGGGGGGGSGGDGDDGGINGEGGGEELQLVVVVCSAIGHVDARRAIRETWGSEARNRSHARLVFLLGRSVNDTLQDRIQRESDKHGDIVQEDFLDTYNNLTLKSVMLLKWVDSACPAAKFVMKTDDDMFVNVPVLLRFLRQRGKTRAGGSAAGASKLLVGSLICGATPIKDKKSKWYAPNSMFAERVYPNYLSGTGYVLSRDLVPLLYQVALETPFFHMEDIYITGICARKLKLKPQDHVGFSYQKRPAYPCLFQKIITGHRMKPSELRKIWREMNKKSLKCDNKKKLRLRDYQPTHCR